MKRYVIKYFISSSQYSNSIYCLESELENNLNELLNDYNAFIDLIGEKDEKDTIGQYDECTYQKLKELGLFEKNVKNEDIVYRSWGY